MYYVGVYKELRIIFSFHFFLFYYQIIRKYIHKSSEMGAAHSTTKVSVLATGEQDSPFSIRRCPGYENEPYQNPEEFQTMKDILLHRFKNFPDNNYLGYRPVVNNELSSEFKFLTTKECEKICHDLGRGLKSIGVGHGDFLGIYSENRLEWGHAIDVSSLYGICLVSLYDSFGMENLAHIISHSGMKTLLVSEKSCVNIIKICAEKKFENLRTIIIITKDRSSHSISELESHGMKVFTFDEICEKGEKMKPIELPKIDPEDKYYVCYSSGTTGQPKGVIISHRSQTSNTLNCYYSLDFKPTERHLSYLPLAHVFERIGFSITSFVGGAIGFYSGNIRLISEDLLALKPTHLSAVPRVITRLYEQILANVGKLNPILQKVFWGAYYWKRFWLSRGYQSYLSDLLLSSVNKKLGGCIRQFIVGGASMDANQHEVMQFLTGIPLRVGYGLSEIGAGNICNPMDIRYIKPGTIGGPLCNCEVRLAPIDDYDDPLAGEIQMGGQCLCSGYLHDDEQTQKLFVDESRKWIHTGDIGKWDSDGYLMVIDRLGSIFKLSQGEYVAAELLTDILTNAQLVSQIFIYGNSSRSYLVAIVVPDLVQLEIVEKRKIGESEFKEMCSKNDKKLIGMIKDQLDAIVKEKKLQGYERINKLALESEPWTPENDLMTPTFKLKRKKLMEKYSDVIEKLYSS